MKHLISKLLWLCLMFMFIQYVEPFFKLPFYKNSTFTRPFKYYSKRNESWIFIESLRSETEYHLLAKACRRETQKKLIRSVHCSDSFNNQFGFKIVQRFFLKTVL